MISLLLAILVFIVSPSLPLLAYGQPVSTETDLIGPFAIVNLSIQVKNGTTFSYWVLTRGHDVHPASGGPDPHHCDGTNFGANPNPGPTATGALDTASRRHDFEWDGIYFPSFDDYFVTTILGELESGAEFFWGLYLNGVFASVGGCQLQVKTGDHVLWKVEAVNESH